MEVVILPAFSDNYIYMLVSETSPDAAVVDPGDGGTVFSWLSKTGRRLVGILNTHHHQDHVGGNKALVERFPGLPVYGSASDRGRIPVQSVFLNEGDEVSICGSAARVLDVPGHTRSHIAYYFPSHDGRPGDLFSGDTIFGGTIGNLFEGTPEVMFRSVRKIRELPPETRIWCSHEYTLQYVREAARIYPSNARTTERLRSLEGSAAQSKPTVPLYLYEECATNPFFRWDDPLLASLISTEPGLATFIRLCEIT